MTNPNIPPEIADATPAPAPVRMVSIRASTLEHVRSAIACALETNHTSNADMRIRWGLSEGRCVIEQVERILCDALTALDSGSQEVAEPVRMRWQVRDCGMLGFVMGTTPETSEPPEMGPVPAGRSVALALAHARPRSGAHQPGGARDDPARFGRERCDPSEPAVHGMAGSVQQGQDRGRVRGGAAVTKSKSKPKPVKPVLAWCALSRDDGIRPGWCATDKATVARWAEHFGRAMIRVEIRPAPKRKSKRTKP